MIFEWYDEFGEITPKQWAWLKKRTKENRRLGVELKAAFNLGSSRKMGKVVKFNDKTVWVEWFDKRALKFVRIKRHKEKQNVIIKEQAI